MRKIEVGQYVARRETTSNREVIAHKPYKIIKEEYGDFYVIAEDGKHWTFDATALKDLWYFAENYEEEKFRELLLNA